MDSFMVFSILSLVYIVYCTVVTVYTMVKYNDNKMKAKGLKTWYEKEDENFYNTTQGVVRDIEILINRFNLKFFEESKILNDLIYDDRKKYEAILKENGGQFSKNMATLIWNIKKQLKVHNFEIFKYSNCPIKFLDKMSFCTGFLYPPQHDVDFIFDLYRKARTAVLYSKDNEMEKCSFVLPFAFVPTDSSDKLVCERENDKNMILYELDDVGEYPIAISDDQREHCERRHKNVKDEFRIIHNNHMVYTHLWSDDLDSEIHSYKGISDCDYFSVIKGSRSSPLINDYILINLMLNVSPDETLKLAIDIVNKDQNTNFYTDKTIKTGILYGDRQPHYNNESITKAIYVIRQDMFKIFKNNKTLNLLCTKKSDGIQLDLLYETK